MAFVVAAGGCGGLPGGRDVGLEDAARVDDGRVSFKVRGFMIIAPANQSARRLGFVWRRAAGGDNEKDGAADVITVRNVAGIVQARMRIDDDGALLATSSRQARAKDAETLTGRAFGMPLPMRLIGDFLGGGGDNAYFRHRLGEKMRKLGWRARFGTHDADGLPMRFGADGGEGSVDIVITGRQ